MPDCDPVCGEFLRMCEAIEKAVPTRAGYVCEGAQDPRWLALWIEVIAEPLEAAQVKSQSGCGVCACLPEVLYGYRRPAADIDMGFAEVVDSLVPDRRCSRCHDVYRCACGTPYLYHYDWEYYPGGPPDEDEELRRIFVAPMARRVRQWLSNWPAWPGACDQDCLLALRLAVEAMRPQAI